MNALQIERRMGRRRAVQDTIVAELEDLAYGISLIDKKMQYKSSLLFCLSLSN